MTLLLLLACVTSDDTGLTARHVARFDPGEIIDACPGDTWDAWACHDYQGSRWCQPVTLWTRDGCVVDGTGEPYADGSGREIIVRWP